MYSRLHETSHQIKESVVWHPESYISAILSKREQKKVQNVEKSKKMFFF